LIYDVPQNPICGVICPLTRIQTPSGTDDHWCTYSISHLHLFGNIWKIILFHRFQICNDSNDSSKQIQFSGFIFSMAV